MNSQSSSKQISPHWLVRFFGAESATFQLTSEGVQLLMKNDCKYLIGAESLANDATFQEGRFFAGLSVQTNVGPKAFSGLPKKEAQALFGWLRAHWLRQFAPEVAATADEIRALLITGYPRQSKLDVVRAKAQQVVVRFGRVPEPEWCPDVKDVPFKWVATVAGWQDADLDLQRQGYVARQLYRYADFFAAVESQPLTERQREACVADEDNNLVLAGAGTHRPATGAVR